MTVLHLDQLSLCLRMHLTCSVYKRIQRMMESNLHGAEHVKGTCLLYSSLECICQMDWTPTVQPSGASACVIASDFDNGTCALKLYLDLLWTVWYRKWECGLDISLLSEWPPKKRLGHLLYFTEPQWTHTHTHRQACRCMSTLSMKEWTNNTIIFKMKDYGHKRGPQWKLLAILGQVGPFM